MTAVIISDREGNIEPREGNINEIGFRILDLSSLELKLVNRKMFKAT